MVLALEVLGRQNHLYVSDVIELGTNKTQRRMDYTPDVNNMYKSIN
jgi:hypothetical protein